jgi:hypothetical protein
MHFHTGDRYEAKGWEQEKEPKIILISLDYQVMKAGGGGENFPICSIDNSTI